MPKLIICRGLPASGKTTWAKEQVRIELLCHQEPISCDEPELHKVCRINRDDIRAMLHDGQYIKGVTEEVVIAVRNASIRDALRKGWDVISDDTNLKSSVVRDLMKIAKREGAEVEFKDFTDVPLETCIERDYMRQYQQVLPYVPPQSGSRYVGEDVIRDMHERFLKNKKLPLPIPEMDEVPTFAPVDHGIQPTIIVDIDGTVAHNNGHRGWYEYDKVHRDQPVKPVVEVVRELALAYGNIIFLSGRKDECREITEQWLHDNVLYGTSFRVRNDSNKAMDACRSALMGAYLLMRQSDDERDDALVKYELYRDYIAPKFDVKMVFDDRDRVVRMWRQIGLVCSQVNYGDF